jgi:hypothetical protein
MLRVQLLQRRVGPLALGTNNSRSAHLCPGPLSGLDCCAWGEDSEPGFVAGNVGKVCQWSLGNPQYDRQRNLNWDAAELPAGPAGQSNWLFWGPMS